MPGVKLLAFITKVVLNGNLCDLTIGLNFGLFAIETLHALMMNLFTLTGLKQQSELTANKALV